MDLTSVLATGYRLTDLTSHPELSQETPAYAATLTRDGTTLATVTSHGTGGAPIIRFSDSQQRRTFEAAAADLLAGEEVAAFLPADEELINHLYLHASIAGEMDQEARANLLVQLPDDGDFWSGGTYRAVALRGLDRAECLAALRAKHPALRVWDPATRAFHPASL